MNHSSMEIIITSLQYRLPLNVCSYLSCYYHSVEPATFSKLLFEDSDITDSYYLCIIKHKAELSGIKYFCNTSATFKVI